MTSTERSRRRRQRLRQPPREETPEETITRLKHEVRDLNTYIRRLQDEAATRARLHYYDTAPRDAEIRELKAEIERLKK
jgi:predicted RNase H-like nuclease (RuvC/YqgF family)